MGVATGVKKLYRGQNLNLAPTLILTCISRITEPIPYGMLVFYLNAFSIPKIFMKLTNFEFLKMCHFAVLTTRDPS